MIYLPVLQEFFRTQPLSASDLSLSLALGGMVFVAFEREKWLVRRIEVKVNVESPPWSQTTRVTVALVLSAGAILLAILAMPLVEAVVIAGLFAFLFDPLINWLCHRRHMARTWAVRLLFVVGGLLAAAIPTGLGALVISGIDRWSRDYMEAIIALREWIVKPRFVMGFDVSPRLLIEQIGQAAGQVVPLVPGGSLNLLSSLGENLLWSLVIIVLLYIFLKDGAGFKGWLTELVPVSFRSEGAHLLDDITTIWAVFVRAQVIIFLILLSLFLVGAWIVILLYQLGLIPFSTFGLIVMLVVVYLLVSQVDNLWLKPVLYSHHLRMHPGVVFVALVSGFVLGGVLLAFIIVPLVATLNVLLGYLRFKLLDEPLVREAPAEPEQGIKVSE